MPRRSNHEWSYNITHRASVLHNAKLELVVLLHCAILNQNLNDIESHCNDVKNIYAHHASGQVQFQSPMCNETDRWLQDRLTIAANEWVRLISSVREVINRTSAPNRERKQWREEQGWRQSRIRCTCSDRKMNWNRNLQQILSSWRRAKTHCNKFQLVTSCMTLASYRQCRRHPNLRHQLTHSIIKVSTATCQ